MAESKEGIITPEDELVGRLAEFYSQMFRTDLEAFFIEHCDEFKDFVTGDEQSFIHTEIFQEYEAIVENHLTELAFLEGLQHRDLIDKVKLSTRRNDMAALVLDLIICSSDFTLFCQIMKMKYLEKRVSAC